MDTFYEGCVYMYACTMYMLYGEVCICAMRECVYRKRINFRCKTISRFMDWAHNFLFSCALIFVVQVGVVNSLWTGPIIFNFRAH